MPAVKSWEDMSSNDVLLWGTVFIVAEIVFWVSGKPDDGMRSIWWRSISVQWLGRARSIGHCYFLFLICRRCGSSGRDQLKKQLIRGLGRIDFVLLKEQYGVGDRDEHAAEFRNVLTRVENGFCGCTEKIGYDPMRCGGIFGFCHRSDLNGMFDCSA